MIAEIQSQRGEKNNHRFHVIVDVDTLELNVIVDVDTLELNVFTEEGVEIKLNLDKEIELLSTYNHSEDKLLNKALIKRLKMKDRIGIFSFEEKLKDQYPFLDDLSLEQNGI